MYHPTNSHTSESPASRAARSDGRARGRELKQCLFELKFTFLKNMKKLPKSSVFLLVSPVRCFRKLLAHMYTVAFLGLLTS